MNLKTFIWNSFIYKFYKDYLDEYAQEYFNDNYEECGIEPPLWNDLD